MPIPGFKETAFLYAISSAGLTHALAKACSAGRMERCTCDEAPDLENREAWQWGGCGDNLKYSSKFVKEFLGRRSSKDLRARVDFHNNLVGVKVSGAGHRAGGVGRRDRKNIRGAGGAWDWRGGKEGQKEPQGGRGGVQGWGRDCSRAGRHTVEWPPAGGWRPCSASHGPGTSHDHKALYPPNGALAMFACRGAPTVLVGPPGGSPWLGGLTRIMALWAPPVSQLAGLSAKPVGGKRDPHRPRWEAWWAGGPREGLGVWNPLTRVRGVSFCPTSPLWPGLYSERQNPDLKTSR